MDCQSYLRERRLSPSHETKGGIQSILFKFSAKIMNIQLGRREERTTRIQPITIARVHPRTKDFGAGQRRFSRAQLLHKLPDGQQSTGH